MQFWKLQILNPLMLLLDLFGQEQLFKWNYLRGLERKSLFGGAANNSCTSETRNKEPPVDAVFYCIL